ncbi:hypothetical protein PPTG_23674 [Phytophthora nicotianae INRA-310]|uniref:Uncharacterized protein n=1 Tax=Phytophthora nicotianae (strain INRA-310) TaxID=761204 RepID=W2PV97_PHYN3|nr:hypothetical protein PPTG_23674 [Phytophthora nicotianae INRA-310]ETN03955.1 hypothetical protein PPTG_23674 [Phytophthora nicotianae INRA-310]
MVIIAALRAVKFVLLLPEKWEHPLEAPTFAKVHRRTRRTRHYNYQRPTSTPFHRSESSGAFRAQTCTPLSTGQIAETRKLKCLPPYRFVVTRNNRLLGTSRLQLETATRTKKYWLPYRIDPICREGLEEGGANIQAPPSTTGAPKAPRAADIQDAVPHLVQSANEREIRVKVQMKPVKNDTSRASKSTHASGREVTISSTAITKDIDVLIPSQNGKKLCIRFLSVRGCKPNEVTFSSRCRQNDSFQNHTIAQSTNGKRRYINTSPIPQPAATQALSAHVDGSIKRQLRPAVRTQVRQSTSTKGRKFKHRWQYIDPLPDKQPATISTESVWPPPLAITSSKIIRQYLEEDLLRAEVATSRRLRTLGFRRVPIAKNTI